MGKESFIAGENMIPKRKEAKKQEAAEEDQIKTSRKTPEKFDVEEYRRSIAEKIKKEPNREVRKDILEEIKKEKKYSIAEKFTRLKRRLSLETKGFFTPERLDILTSMIKGDFTQEEKDEIMQSSYEDLIFQLSAQETDFPIEKICDYLEENLKKREKLTKNIDQYITEQGQWPDIVERGQAPLKLRGYQVRALEKINDFIKEGYLRGYISHPTGTGKTVLFSSLIKASDAKTLIVVPSRVLVNQTISELKNFLPDKKLSFIGSVKEKSLAGMATKGAKGDIVVAIDESVKLNSKNLRKKEFDLVIWDEVHNSYTALSQNALRYFPSSIKIGFTATPAYYYLEKKPGYEEITLEGVQLYRNPKKSASYYYPHEIDSISLREAIESKMLVPLHEAIVDVDINLDEVKMGRTKHGMDYNETSLNELLEKHWPALRDLAVNSFFNGIGREDDPPEHRVSFRNKQIFAVCSKVSQAENLAEAFREHGISAECVVGNTPDNVRDEIFERYKNRQTQILTSVNVLKEGWNRPEAEVCMMMRPTLSRTFYQQAMGRVLRLDSSNKNKRALVVDFLGKYTRMAPLTAAGFFGIREFYNGEMIIPPKKEPPPGIKPTAFPPEEELNPFNVCPRLRIIETIENREEITRDIMRLNGHIYCTKKQIIDYFSIRKEFLENFIEDENPEFVKINRDVFFKVDNIINDFLNREISLVESRLSLRRISYLTNLTRSYLEKIARQNRINGRSVFTVSGHHYLEYDTEEIWDSASKEIRKKMEALQEMEAEPSKQKEGISRSPALKKAIKHEEKEEIHEIDLDALDLQSPQNIIIALQKMAYQKGNEGIRKNLKRIEITRYIPKAREYLLEIKNRQDLKQFKKIANECDRLLAKLSAAEIKTKQV